MTRSPLGLRGLLLLAVCALSSCVSHFKLDLHAPEPGQVGSVFVLFGDEKVLDAEATSAAVAALIQPGKLQDAARYPAYIECMLDEYGNWKILSERPSEDIYRLADRAEEDVLHFKFNHKYLKQIPRLALAIVVRDTQNVFRRRYWAPEIIANLDAPLSIRVQGGETPVVDFVPVPAPSGTGTESSSASTGDAGSTSSSDNH